MASKPPADLDPKQVEKAQALWENFGVATKYGVIITCLVLIVMAITLL